MPAPRVQSPQLSRVFNGVGGVGGTRRRVLTAIDELGYDRPAPRALRLPDDQDHRARAGQSDLFQLRFTTTSRKRCPGMEALPVLLTNPGNASSSIPTSSCRAED